LPSFYENYVYILIPEAFIKISCVINLPGKFVIPGIEKQLRHSCTLSSNTGYPAVHGLPSTGRSTADARQ
jgi:hypothetical protein